MGHVSHFLFIRILMIKYPVIIQVQIVFYSRVNKIDLVRLNLYKQKWNFQRFFHRIYKVIVNAIINNNCQI